MTDNSEDGGIQRMPYGQSPPPPPPPGTYGAPAGYHVQPDPSQGYQPQGYQPQGYQPQPPFAGRSAPTSGLGVAGFVTGLLGLLLCWVPFLGLILAACGIVLSGIGMSQAKSTGASTGLAVAGLVLGILALIPSLFFLAAVLSLTTSP